jgi:Zn-dependent protease with chaperone function/type II secretory pathway pseudopilin PulG
MALDARLVLPRERTLFVLGVIFSSLAWLLLVVSLIGLAYGLFIGLFLLAAQALFLAHVRSNGIRVGPAQLPELHARIENAGRVLGLARLPEVYVLQSHGVLNAFATKLFSRRYVVLLSALVDHCEDPRQLDFVVAHELAHQAAGHVAWLTFLLPYRLVPWLGAAYSRACEYTCDRCGLAVVNDLQAAQRGLLVLAAGGRLAAKVDLAAFLAQRQESGSFWSTVLELTSSHPFLTKRVGALQEFATPGAVAPVSRSLMGVLLAPALGGLGGAVGGTAPLMMVAIIGILAAIAIPNFVRYQLRAKAAATPIALQSLHAAEQAYFAAHGEYLAVRLGAKPGTGLQRWSAEDQKAAAELGWTLPAASYAAFAVKVGSTQDGQQAFSACAETDLDGDGAVAASMIWQPVDGGDGTLVGPGSACRFGPNLTRAAEYQPADQPGVPVQVSGADVF